MFLLLVYELDGIKLEGCFFITLMIFIFEPVDDIDDFAGDITEIQGGMSALLSFERF